MFIDEIIKVLHAHCWCLELFPFTFYLLDLHGRRFDRCRLSNRVYSELVEVGREGAFKLLDAGEIILERLGSENSFLLFCGADAACSFFIFIHKTDQAEDNCGNGPARVPELGVVVAEVSAYFFAGLKSSIGRQHLNTWGLEGVVSWETESSVVEAALEGAVFKSVNNKMPFKNVFFLWHGYKI